MSWHAWLFLVLLVAVSAGWLIWWLVLRNRSAMARVKLSKMELDHQRALTVLEDHKVARLKAEEARTRHELKALEEKHHKKLKDLKEEERGIYEALKDDPQAGVDFIRDLLDGDGPG